MDNKKYYSPVKNKYNMATIKLLLQRQKTSADGTTPIYLRLIKDRKAQFISLNLKIYDKDWDEDKQKVKKSHPNAGRLNAYLAQKVAEAEKLACEMASENKAVKTQDIKQELIGVAKTKTDIFIFAEHYYNTFQAKGKHGTFLHYKYVFSKLKTYLGNKKLYVEDLNVTFLKDYENYMRMTLENKQNTIYSSMKSIQKIMNLATEEDLIPYDKNPFLKYKFSMEAVDKVFLTDDEIHSIENLDLNENTKLELYRDAFVFSSYVGGLRCSDICMLRWENINEGAVTIRTIKSSSTVTIKIPNKALEILEKYKPENPEPKRFIFGLLYDDTDYSNGKYRTNDTSNANMKLNAGLSSISKKCSIEKKITFHTARHTFATRALKKGMRIEYVSKLMAHSDIKTTQIYAKIVNEELDKAMDVFND